MKFVIVIPTYNERENVSKLVPLINKHLPKNSEHTFELLFVDGNSPDGTVEELKILQKQHSNINYILEVKKNGLGAAYFYGFQHAITKMNADVIMEMDADLQHDPKDLHKFIKAIDEGYDYVIGSRYINGGSIPKEWSFNRKFLSWGGSTFARITLGIFKVKDFTTGFKASRVKGFVDKIDFSKVLSKGFAYKIDLLYTMNKLGAKIKEVPITFGLRDRGNSKMEGDNFRDSLRVVFSIIKRDYKNLIKFIIVGFSGLIVDTSLFTIFMYSIFSPGVSSKLSGLFAMMVTYSLNNFWSFKENKITSKRKFAGTFGFYFVSSYIPILFRSVFISYAVSYIADNVFVRFGAFFFGIFLGLIWNFTIYSKIIWKGSNND